MWYTIVMTKRNVERGRESREKIAKATAPATTKIHRHRDDGKIFIRTNEIATTTKNEHMKCD